jgi:uncharacterized protein YdaU (DUF1376 family)
VNYYERHIGDYLKDTAHLSLLEHGIYTRLLDVYYTRESGIPSAECGRLVGAKSKDEKAALGVVLAEFFVLAGDILKQTRCDLEIARFQDKQRKAKASADARWSHTDRNATAMRTHTEGNALQTPDTRPIPKEQKTPRKRGTPLPEGFVLSDRVGEWAGGEGYSLHDVQANFEAFVSYAKRKGATYVDWDEALMTAIRKDWAEVRAKPASETGYQRSMRELAHEIHPAIARAAPGAPKQNPMEILDGLAVARIAG